MRLPALALPAPLRCVIGCARVARDLRYGCLLLAQSAFSTSFAASSQNVACQAFVGSAVYRPSLHGRFDIFKLFERIRGLVLVVLLI
jgi:hypothetical protein